MKKTFRTLALACALVMLVGVLPALAGGQILTDMTGRQVTLDAPAQRLVVLAAADCEILYALGAGDRLVGRGEYCNYPAEVLEVPAVQSGAQTNLEQILALKPDAVVMPKMAQQKEQVEALEKAGIPVFVTDAADIAGTYTAIRLMGDITGQTQQAEAVISTMETGFAALQEKVKAVNKPASVYFEVSPLQWGLWSAGQGTFMQEIAQILNLTNIFEDIDGWKEVSAEQVLSRDPDYIVTVAMYFGEGPTPVEEIKGRAGWENLKALKNDAIFNADSDSFARPGPRLLDAAQSLYDFVYGTQAENNAA
jgi:iron complex transport system substrate-binding protein